jgi:flavin reductase (DIM6/NTAB) family NADH-FMN oxidoreductase RutF
LTHAYGRFTTGVALITGARASGEPVGVTISSFASVSLDPPLVLWCLRAGSSAVPAFAAGRNLVIHVLAEHQRDVAEQFARRIRDKFGLSPLSSSTLEGAICRLGCVVEAVFPGGDHRIILCRVLRIETSDGNPLVFYSSRFGQFAEAAELK